ncbi:MAG: FIST N-terminal domain-containing protein [Chloroflexota bacterium]
MKSKSISSLNTNPYEAGLELGEALHSIQPEAILLFASIHYADFSELFDGLYDGLETRDVTIIGGAGAGIYETSQVGDVGVCALGFNSNGTVTWSLALESDIMADAYSAGQNCADSLLAQAQDDDLSFSFIFSGMGGNGNQLTAGIRSVTDTPCVGGLTGDGSLFHKGVVLVNGRLYEDTVAMLGVSGNLSFRVNLASGWCPVGYPGVVEKINGTSIEQISGQPAAEFVSQQISQQPLEGALDFMTLAAYQQNGNEEQFTIRAPYKTDEDSGVISYYGSVEPGTPVRVCFATREDVMSGVDEAVEGLPELDFEPIAGLVISCAVRKFILGESTANEVKNLAPALPASMPLVGAPTFGEIAPHPKADGSYSGTYFHNVTYVLAVFGVPTT